MRRRGAIPKCSSGQQRSSAQANLSEFNAVSAALSLKTPDTLSAAGALLLEVKGCSGALRPMGSSSSTRLSPTRPSNWRSTMLRCGQPSKLPSTLQPKRWPRISNQTTPGAKSSSIMSHCPWQRDAWTYTQCGRRCLLISAGPTASLTICTTSAVALLGRRGTSPCLVLVGGKPDLCRGNDGAV